jgi:hypothetical protein
MRTSRRILTALLVLGLAGIVPQAATAEPVPNPVVQGPITGGVRGRPWMSSVVDLAMHNFVEQEFFLSGSSMGVPYTTRIIVRRPNDGTFSGTVIMDWINVTGGTDLETLWPPAMPVYFAERHAYVGLTAQVVGVGGLKAWDPVRYAPLVHPGDIPHSNNILAQAVQAVRAPNGVDPLQGNDVDYVVVGGSSQSAIRLQSYITDPTMPIVGHIDAFWISRTGSGGTIKPVADALGVKMIHSMEEGISGTQPDDSANYKVWEGAGQAHAPKSWSDYVWKVYQRDLWMNAVDVRNGVDAGCGMNRGTVEYQGRAGVHWLNLWVRGECLPPTAPRIARDGGGAQVRDADGNVQGGLRYPFIEVPLATNSSTGCPLFGHHRAWSREKIVETYPTHAAYHDLVAAHVAELQAGGFLLPNDATEILAAAAAFDVWGASSCYDTTPSDAAEEGPVSGVLHSVRNEKSPVGLGIPAAVGEASCNLAALGL